MASTRCIPATDAPTGDAGRALEGRQGAASPRACVHLRSRQVVGEERAGVEVAGAGRSAVGLSHPELHFPVCACVR